MLKPLLALLTILLVLALGLNIKDRNYSNEYNNYSESRGDTLTTNNHSTLPSLVQKHSGEDFIDTAQSNTDRYNVNEGLSQIQMGDYSNIEQFHNEFVKCLSTKEFVNFEEFYDSENTYFNLSHDELAYFFETCKSLPIKNVSELDKIYSLAAAHGNKDAEFLLGVLYPPQFSRSILWLTRSATWKNESEELLFQFINKSPSTSDDLKYFWNSIFVLREKINEVETIESLIRLEGKLSNEDRIHINELATLWIRTSSESEKREILQRLFEDEIL